MNSKKRKILICGDDPRTASGVGTQLKYIAEGLIKKGFEIIVIGGIRKRHPGDDKPTMWNGIKIYPVEGYGNPNLLRNILTVERPDGIMLFTDPRYWVWVWLMEDEIRTEIPILYYNLWDDGPIQPDHYNKNFYKSCDGLIQISKQTNVFMNNVFKLDEDVELVPEQRYKDVIDIAHKNAGMSIYRGKNEK